MKIKNILYGIAAICGLLALSVPARCILTGWEPTVAVGLSAVFLVVAAFAIAAIANTIK